MIRGKRISDSSSPHWITSMCSNIPITSVQNQQCFFDLPTNEQQTLLFLKTLLSVEGIMMLVWKVWRSVNLKKKPYHALEVVCHSKGYYRFFVIRRIRQSSFAIPCYLVSTLSLSSEYISLLNHMLSLWDPLSWFDLYFCDFWHYYFFYISLEIEIGNAIHLSQRSWHINICVWKYDIFI